MIKIKKKKSKEKHLIIFAPFIEKGGIEKNIFILTKYFLNNLNKVILITSNNKVRKKFKKNLKLISPNKKILIINNRFIKNLACLVLLIFTIINLKKKCIVFSFQSNLYVTILAKILKIKNIVRIAVYGWMYNSIKKKIFKFFLPLSTHTIVNSKEMKNNLKSIMNIKSTCIYNPLNKIEIDQSKNTKKKFFKYQNSLKILFLGRLVDQKDPLTFLKSLELINDNIKYEALMVGSGNLRNEILEFIKKKKLSLKVKLVSYKNVPSKYVNQCDLFILTSKYEGLPNVLLEAQYLKKYIISTDCKTGPKEILRNGQLGDLIKVGDYKMLANKIIKFKKNKNKFLFKKKIATAFRETKRFDYELNCRKYLDLVKKYL